MCRQRGYLIRKLQGSSGIVGGQMPLGGSYLPQSTIDVIRQWITEGAPKSESMSAALNAHAFAVTSTAPLDGASATQPVTQVLVAFTHGVDAALVNDTTVMLERLSPSGSSADTSAAAVAMTISVQFVTANPNVLLLQARDGLSSGTYRVRLRGTGAAALADMNAAALGVDYSFTFTVNSRP